MFEIRTRSTQSKRQFSKADGKPLSPLYIRLDVFNCILTPCNRMRCSRAPALQALPRPLPTRFFVGIFFFFCISLYFLFLAQQYFCCFSRRQRSSLLWPARPAPRAGAGRHGATGLRGQVSSATSSCERRIKFFLGRRLVIHGSHQPSRWSGRGMLIFRHDTRRQIWSGSLSSQVRHRGFRILSTATVALCHREECFSLFHSALLEGDRAPRGCSLLCQKRRKLIF